MERVSKKRTPVTTSIQGAVEEFGSVMSDLKQELEDSKDALEERFSGTPRYEALETAIGEIEEWIDEVDTLDWEDSFGDVSVTYITNQRRGISRSVRRDNAVSAISEAISGIEGWLADNDEHDDRDAAEEIKDKLEEWMSSAEGIEFPGWSG